MASDVFEKAYLPGTGDTLITKEVLPGRGTPLHSGVLTPANIPNVDISGTQFLVAGDCVRAIPYKISINHLSHEKEFLMLYWMQLIYLVTSTVIF